MYPYSASDFKADLHVHVECTVLENVGLLGLFVQQSEYVCYDLRVQSHVALFIFKGGNKGADLFSWYDYTGTSSKHHLSNKNTISSIA